jgi:lysozyme
MAMKLGQKGLDLIKSFESFVPYVYDDKLAPINGKYKEWTGGTPKGTLTIGYGHTNAARDPLKIKKGLRITEAKAVQILNNDLGECEENVNLLVTVTLTQGQYDALVSFAFNCGIKNLKKILVPLNKGDYEGCKQKLGEFIRSKGEVMKGLVRRRNAEQALFDDPYQIGVAKIDTLEVPVPKANDANSAPSKIENLVKSPVAWASGGTFASTVIGAVTDWRIMSVIVVGLLVAFILWKRSQKP